MSIVAAKDSQLCLICSGRVGVSTRTSLPIFSKETQTCSERPLTTIMADVLGQEIKEDSIHSYLICKKCFKLFDEVDELELRIVELKTEILNNYKKSVHKSKNGELNEEHHKTFVQKESNKENRIPKKILDIPSSDDENIQTEKPGLNMLEDIEMELVKIHGGNDDDDEKSGEVFKDDPDDELEDSNQTFHGFPTGDGDAGMMEHSSDEEYQPDSYISEKGFMEKGLVEVKTEPGLDEDDKPNILKRKMFGNNGSNSKKFFPKKIKEEYVPEKIVIREGTLYTCLLCEGNETVCGEAKAIMQHVKMSHNARIYICDVCGEDFRKRNELSAHVDDHVATEEGDFQCEVCNRIFSNLRLFRIHKRMHYPQNKAWTCDICGRKYSSKNLLDEHLNVHNGIRPYVCHVCNKSFASKYTFKAHEKTHEFRPRPFQCSQCTKSFLSQQNLNQHERTHSGLKDYQCHLCDKQFGSAHNLEVHSIVHTGYKPYICGTCGKAFARKAEIRDHERTHTGERPYQCEFCGATFSQRSNLQSHKRATHYDDKRYICNVCGKGFKRRRLLDYHMKAAHTGERPFKCDICEATFVYPEHFKKHRRIHTGEKPFLCEVCGKAFNSRDNRNAHRFVHSDKKPYECLICGTGFMRKPLLYQHMQAQGHLNDTIVVNQPRLTTDDDQVITVNARGEMEIVDGDVSTLEHIDPNEAAELQDDSKLYIADFKNRMLLDKNEMFSDNKNSLIVGGNMNEEHMEENEAVEHIIIDGPLQYAEEEEEEEVEEVEGIEQQQDLNTNEYEGISEAFVNGETQIIQTKDGPIQLVQVRIPNDNGEEENAWIKIIP